MKLAENSLYTTAAERDALVKDKKRVMDALCFSLLGFLGCFKLGDTRAALKTYDRTEGQLRLNAIGDKNHDVSLSVKLADEAGVIPNSAAQNVTKLLYMIKSRKIRGADLDDQKVRDIVKTLKISSNPPDSMINAIINEFEAGSLNLGQLAAKLYNLSKLPKFKTISGEFRALVSKGQFTELFAKAGTATPTPASITTSSPKNPVSTTALSTPVQPTVVDTYAMATPDKRKEVFAEMLKDKQIGDYNTPPEAIAKAGGTRTDLKSWLRGFATYLCERVFVEKDVDIFTTEITKYVVELFQAKYKFVESQTLSDVSRALLAASWLLNYADVERGDLRRITPTFNIVIANIVLPINKTYTIDTFTFDFVKRYTTDQMFGSMVKYADKNTDSISGYTYLVRAAYVLSGGTEGDMRMKTVASSWKFDTTFAEWYIRSHGMNAVIADVFKPISNNETIELIDKVFDLKAPKIVTLNTDPRVRARFVVPVSLNSIQNRALSFIANMSSSLLFFYDTDNWEADFKAKTENRLERALHDIWSNMVRDSREAIAMPPGYLNSEAFIQWFCKQLEGQKAADVFKNMPVLPASPEVVKLYLNMGVNFLDIRGVTPKIWMSLYAFSLSVGQAGATYLKDLEDLYAENFGILQSTLSNAFAADTKIVYSAGASIGAFLLKMHKENKFAPPNDMDFWRRIAQFTATELGEWTLADKIQEALFELDEDVDVIAIRTSLLQKYKHTRDWYYGDLLNDLKSSDDSTYIVKEFLTSGWTDVVDKKDIPSDMIAFVEDNLKRIDAHSAVIFSNNVRVGAWARDLVKASVERSLFSANATMSIMSLLNAQHLGIQTFNKLVESADLKKIIATESGDSVDEHTAMIKIWTELEKDVGEIPPTNLQKLIIGLGMNMQKSATPKSLEPCVDALCNILNGLLAHDRATEVDNLFDSMTYSVKMKADIINWFSKAGVLSNALKMVKNDVISPLQEIDQTRLGQLMKYNNIKLPDDKTIDYKKQGFKLSDFLKTHGNWKLEALAVSDEMTDKASLDRRTAEFDVFNKYRHGQIGVKFLRSFKVSIPIQEEQTAKWDEQHPTSMIMDPVFHGTGSIAASFILRYGFAVISSNDSSVVGRMLGDGVYFSNVLDKCGQYISDGGYSRGVGNKGYLFQMRASLGQRGPDYQAGGGNLVSPEWCVFHPNKQLRIYKAHFVELVSQDVIRQIKAKTATMNESTAIRIYEMDEHLNPDITAKGCISYTFIDGKIPISEVESIDFEHWDPSSVPPNVTMEYSGLGPVVYIQVDDPSVAEIYAVRFTSSFMNQADDFAKYLQLIRGGTTS